MTPGRGLALALVASVLASGCVAPAVDLSPAGVSGPLVVIDPDGEPVPYPVFALLAKGVVVARGSGGLHGSFAIPEIAFDEALLSATGFETRAFSKLGLRTSPVLPRTSLASQANESTPVLRMLPPYDFGTTYLGPAQACSLRNTCGMSEAVLEVAGDGAIYASGTCCVGKSPPVFVSRDGGATWEELRTPGVREAVGIEGDLAIDDAGNVYFTDILLGALWLTSWDKDGAWRHTVPVPLPPLVDRPWVRAGAENVVYFLYNRGGSTGFHASTDGGRTFSLGTTFPAGIGNLGQGPERDHLWVTAGRELYESTDGGATWSEGEAYPLPATPKDGREPGGTGYNFRDVPVVDEAGNVLITYAHGSNDEGFAIYGVIRSPDGAWTGPFLVSSAGGTHFQPWPAAGKAGGFLVAWYGTDAEATHPDQVEGDTPWYIHLAATHDLGRTWQVVRADPEPVAEGPMLRRLLDFVQVDVAPAGAGHLAYSRNTDGTRGEVMLHARTTTGLGLAPLVFPHGPKDAREPPAAGPLALVR